MSPFPIVDLFAGPGGLGEGFSAVTNKKGRKSFAIGLSIEKDPVAHETLSLRAAFRHLATPSAKALYLDFIQGHAGYDDFSRHRMVSAAIREAAEEARKAELGKSSTVMVDRWIRNAIGKRDDWVLIGGPPCQAYSLAGRSRRTNDESFEQDEKHLLYREYLRIISRFEPAVFVMENVKGLLSSKHSGSPIFDRIISELSRPRPNLEYEIRSFVCDPGFAGYVPKEFVIRAENFGIPQTRHRVILLGIRKDLSGGHQPLLHPCQTEVTVADMLADMPRLRSRISKDDDFEAWHATLNGTLEQLRGWKGDCRNALEQVIERSAKAASALKGSATTRPDAFARTAKPIPKALKAWISHNAPPTICQHDARGHMPTDLQRYLFAASFAQVTGRSPKLQDFPRRLLPDHANAREDDPPNVDRFRVQLADRPSTTVVSHIAKDGHYYIHPDPSQCRSLTVREAARLQTFPDNYFFMGERTNQYAQVGNAVPPFLALQLGEVVAEVMARGSSS